MEEKTRLQANDLPALIRERDLARRWDKSRRTLQRMRAAGKTPAWFRIGAAVHYRIEDVLDHERRLLGEDGS